MSVEVLILPAGVPRRPAVRWLGSKWRMTPWILQHLPPHELYVETYGGSASVLLRKPRSPIEVLGDMDDELLNFYAVLRDSEMSARLRTACELTLFSDAEFRTAMCRLPADADPVERARRMVVRHAMQVSPDVRGETMGTGFRRYSGMLRRVAAVDWTSYPDAVPEIHARLRGVIIERSPAVETIRRHDRVGALHYIDPPYVHGTRQEARKGYRHEMSDPDHLARCNLRLLSLVHSFSRQSLGGTDMNKLVRLTTAFALTGALATAASAASMTPEQKAVLQQQCAGDFTTVCAGLPPEDSPEVQACFEKNMSKLSPGCQGAIKSYKLGNKG